MAITEPLPPSHRSWGKLLQLRLELTSEYGLRLIKPLPPDRHHPASNDLPFPISKLPNELLQMILSYILPTRENAYNVLNNDRYGDSDTREVLEENDETYHDPGPVVQPDRCFLPITHVCKWWNVMYDRELFKKIYIDDRYTKSSLDNFCNVFRNRSILFTSPRKLVIERTNPKQTEHLLRIVSKCKAVTEARFNGPFTIGTEPVLCIVSRLPHLSSLHLGGVPAGPSLNVISKYLLSTPNKLRSVSFYYFGFGNDDDTKASPARDLQEVVNSGKDDVCPLALKRFQDCVICPAQYLEEMVLLPSAPSFAIMKILQWSTHLVTLTLSPMDNSFAASFTVEVIDEMLEMLSASLKNLRLGQLSKSSRRLPNFAQCKCLEILQFSSSQLGHEPISTDLRRLQAPRLHHITIEARVLPNNTFDPFRFRVWVKWFENFADHISRYSATKPPELQSIFFDYAPWYTISPLYHFGVPPEAPPWNKLNAAAELIKETGINISYHDLDNDFCLTFNEMVMRDGYPFPQRRAPDDLNIPFMGYYVTD